MQRDKVIVIGAGMGGLVSAALLAARGFDVTVIERAAAPGGKLREVTVAGKAIDGGPTVFTMRWAFEAIFAECRADFADALTLLPLDILARHAWDDQARLDLHAQLDASIDAISAFAGPAEAKRYARFCRDASATFATLKDSFLTNTATNPFGLMQRIGFTDLSRIMSIRPYATLWGALGRYFHDPRLRQLFGRYATYSGSSPYQAPATLMLIAHVEQSGVWAVAGGMHQIARALERLATSNGAVLRYHVHTAEILIEHGRAAGVRLENGEVVRADTVIANCDPAAIAIGELGQPASRAVVATPRKKRSLSSFCWLINAPTSGFPLVRHNVFFSRDYAREFRDIFAAGRTPIDPTVYICAQDREVPGASVDAHAERLQIIVNAPPIGDERVVSAAERAECQHMMMTTLARCGLSIAATPETLQLTTPQEFNQLFPATGGALYGRATHGWAAAFQRPGARTAIPGLYLAGGATHPGAGIPMAALSGRQAAQSVLADRASMPAFPPAGTIGGISTR